MGGADPRIHYVFGHFYGRGLGVATTMTGSGELTFVSFPIEKTETTADGDLLVYGKATDGSVDSDDQIVDPAFSAKAIREWLDSGGNVRVQHNPQRDPAGIGVEMESDGDATWVKSLVIEPVAQKLVSKGALRAYSVGIARPTIVRDQKARGGRITDGQIVEISLVDRPANKFCGIQLVKAADDGTPEYSGEVFGADEDIAKALGADITKGIPTIDEVRDRLDLSPWNDDDMSLTFTPNDLAKILQNKIIDQHYDGLAKQALYDAETAVYKRDIDTATRRNLASQGNALPDGSYPIENTGDLHNAAVLARSGHGNVSGARALIARRAKELGVGNPLSEDNNANKAGAPADELVAAPDVVKDPDGDEAEKAKKPKGGKKKMPPWLNKPSGDGDGDADDNGGPSDGDADDKAAVAEAEKCSPSGTPQSASGAKDAQAMDEIPNTGPAPESPMPAGRKTPDTKAAHSDPETAAMLRFKSLGIDADLGRLHDLTCPAFHPDDVFKYHPYADFNTVIDEGLWQRKALDAAAGRPLDEAIAMQQVWQAAKILKNADPAMLNDYRLEMHKAFRDANPGPTSYPSPGSISPGKYKRPLVSDGHSATSPGHDGPNSSPSVASSQPSARGFDRPPLGSGHQSPSPSFMKAGFEYPDSTGTPTHLTYAHMEKEQAHAAIGRMHTHLSMVVPSVCPMDMNSRGDLTPPAVPATVGVGKAEVPAEVVEKAITEDTVELYMEPEIAKAFKKLRKKLGKKVIAGKMTVDEARAKLGRSATQKVDDPEGVIKNATPGDPVEALASAKPLGTERDAPIESNAASQIRQGFEYIQKNYGNPVSPDAVKTAVAEALSPLMKQFAAHEKVYEEKLAEQQKVLDSLNAIADQPDPTTAAFSGLAMNPIRKSRPAGVTNTAEVAERTQQMMVRQLEHTWRTSENPAERESAWKAICKMRGISE